MRDWTEVGSELCHRKLIHHPFLRIPTTVEFYFSDANFPYDKFLFTLSRKDPEGWVPIATLTSFKRMRTIKDQLGMDKVVAILRSSEEIKVNSEGDKVRRARPLVPQKDQFERSVYVKGFPEETATLQAEMEKFFAQFGTIASVRMRRDQSVKGRKAPFKGSVFVEFTDFEQMKEFLAKGNLEDAEHRPKFQEQDLKIMSKEDYCNMKIAEKGIDSSRLQRGGAGGSSSKPNAGPPGKGSARFNAFREMEREARGLPSALSEEKPKAEGASERKARAKENRSKPLEFEFNKVKLSTNPDGTIVESMLTFPEKSVLAFKGAGEGGNWRDLKETLLSIHPTSFVEFPNGAVEGAVGFSSTLEEDKLAEIVNRAITVGGQVVEWSRVDEDRARKFYLDRANFRANFLIDQREAQEAEGKTFNSDKPHQHQNGRGHTGNRGRGGGRGGGRGRGTHRSQRGGGGNDKRKRDDGPSGVSAAAGGPPDIQSSKKAKTEA